jgi:hypothetical protein
MFCRKVFPDHFSGTDGTDSKCPEEGKDLRKTRGGSKDMKKTVVLAAFLLLGGICLTESTLAAGSKRTVFRKNVIIDRDGFGYEAFRLMVPEGWQFRGGVSWNFNRMPPASFTAFTITSPDGGSVMEQLPHIDLFWSDDPNLRMSYSQTGMEIIPPSGAIDFLRNFFIPRFRPNASGISVIDTQTLPELMQRTAEMTRYQLNVFGQISPFQFPYEIRADAARLKMEYSKNGKKIIEDVTASISYMIAYMPSMYGGSVTGITWIPIITTFKAPADEIDEKIKIFKIITDSRKDNPVWAENCLKLAATVTRDQLRNQRAIFDRMRQAGRTQSEIGDMIMDSYQKRNEAYDRIFDNYSEAIRGVDSYVDPINDWKVELPTGYNNAWTDGSDYVFSEDPGFNPNIGSNRNWRQMSRQR